MNSLIRANPGDALNVLAFLSNSTYLHAHLTIMKKNVEPEICERLKKQTSSVIEY